MYNTWSRTIAAAWLKVPRHSLLALLANSACATQELEGAVSCKYVAANAVNALQQVYQALSQTSSSEKAAAQQAWAKILLRPELRRAAEACHILEQAALDSLNSGGTYRQAQGVLLQDKLRANIRHAGDWVSRFSKCCMIEQSPFIVSTQNCKVRQMWRIKQ